MALEQTIVVETPESSLAREEQEVQEFINQSESIPVFAKELEAANDDFGQEFSGMIRELFQEEQLQELDLHFREIMQV